MVTERELTRELGHMRECLELKLQALCWELRAEIVTGHTELSAVRRELGNVRGEMQTSICAHTQPSTCTHTQPSIRTRTLAPIRTYTLAAIAAMAALNGIMVALIR